MRLTGDKCLCTACGLYFKTTASFDRHRQGGYAARRCLTEKQLSRASGWSIQDSFWRIAG